MAKTKKALKVQNHHQKPKAKTKKDMKKSINSLYNTLMDEKTKHAKASKIVGFLKDAISVQNSVLTTYKRVNTNLKEQLEVAQNREKHATEVTADLITAMKT